MCRAISLAGFVRTDAFPSHVFTTELSRFGPFVYELRVKYFANGEMVEGAGFGI